MSAPSQYFEYDPRQDMRTAKDIDLRNHVALKIYTQYLANGPMIKDHYGYHATQAFQAADAFLRASVARDDSQV